MIRNAGGVIGKTQDSIETRYHKRTTNKLMDILQHNSHPLRLESDSTVIKRGAEGEPTSPEQ